MRECVCVWLCRRLIVFTCWLKNNPRHLLQLTDVTALREDGWLGNAVINTCLYILAKSKDPEWAVMDSLVIDVLKLPPNMHDRRRWDCIATKLRRCNGC